MYFLCNKLYHFLMRQRLVSDFFHQGQILFLGRAEILIRGRIFLHPLKNVLLLGHNSQGRGHPILQLNNDQFCHLTPMSPMRAFFLIRGRNILFQISSGAYSEGGGVCTPDLIHQRYMPLIPHGPTNLCYEKTTQLK